jgi:hypothetical protein
MLTIRFEQLGITPGDLVLDLYAGLGSVPVACALEGRRYAGAEIDPEHRHTGLRFWRQFLRPRLTERRRTKVVFGRHSQRGLANHPELIGSTGGRATRECDCRKGHEAECGLALH